MKIKILNFILLIKSKNIKIHIIKFKNKKLNFNFIILKKIMLNKKIHKNDILIRTFGIQNYQKILKNMNSFTKKRKENTLDELWILEHYSVFTQGKSEKKKLKIKKKFQ